MALDHGVLPPSRAATAMIEIRVPEFGVFRQRSVPSAWNSIR
jgi:hypothetical protein